MVSASRVAASDWIWVSVVVSGAGQGRSVIEGIQTCVKTRQWRTLTWAYNSTVVWLPPQPSYCFVLDYLFINPIQSSHFAHVSVFLCLAVLHVRIPSIMEHLSPAVLTTTLSSIQPITSSLLADTMPLRHFHHPHSSLYKLHVGGTGFLWHSWTLRMGVIGCPKPSVRNYHYSLHNDKSTYLGYFTVEAWNHT
jgi:hypothetical protein